MIRLILVSSEFGVYIDKHGVLTNDHTTIEWEGIAERVSYHHPYVLLFSAGFVEVRHAVTGRLEQIVPGDSMRCLWEGNGSPGVDVGDGEPSQYLGLIGITNTPAGLDELAVQCIFTLVPSKRSPSPSQIEPSLLIPERARL